MSTTTNSVNTVIEKVKDIKHGVWNFEYRNNKNIFSISPELFDDRKFKIYDVNKTVNNYNSNQLVEKDLEDFRRAGSIHKIVRQKARSMLCDGVEIANIVNTVERLILDLTRQD
jgi:hypothetical protein